MMRATKLTFFILLLIVASMTGCASSGVAQKKEESKEEAPQTQKKEWLDYEPAVVELEGKLVVKKYFGPPNFGEDPTTDSKEYLPVLLLSNPVNVRASSTPDAGNDDTPVEDVREMELVLRMPHKNLINKKVVIKGTLFHAHTGHHHTDVLMDVQTIRLDTSH